MATQGVVIAIDAGTTGVRSFALDAEGRPVGWAYREFPQHFPQPGWVEHDADEIWAAVCETLSELTARLEAPVAAVGITNQRETTVVWSRSSGAPLARAIVWQDRRTADRCRALTEAGHLDLVRRTTGLVLDPYFSGTKLAWLLGEGGVTATPDLAFGTIDSWLIWKLTDGAVHATDPTNASRTMLYDIAAGRWSDELVGVLGVPAACLPEVRPSSGRFGTVAAGICPLAAGTPISGVAGDQQAALFGQACFEPGMTKNTYGTGSFVLMNVGPDYPEPVEGLLTTVAASASSGAGPDFALEGAIFVTGAAIQWLRDGLGMIGAAEEVGPLADSVPTADGAYVVPAFTGLGSPYWDPEARGTIVGLTRGIGRAQIARAVVESMAYSTRDVVDAMSSASGRAVTELRVDGGAAVMPLLLQLVADQLDVPVTRPSVTETTALGAAYLAGLAEGVWSSPSEVSDAWAVDVRVAPSGDRGAVDAAYAGWQRAVERAGHWA